MLFQTKTGGLMRSLFFEVLKLNAAVPDLEYFDIVLILNFSELGYIILWFSGILKKDYYT